MSGFPLRPTWAEINVSSIAHNIKEFRRIIPSCTRIMAVVKADGYGHGAVETAREALVTGASFIGVSLVEEALKLRQNGITEPILILGYTPREYASLILEHHLVPTVFTLPEAETFSDTAVRYGRKIPVHVKVDTGMGRVGYFPCEDAGEFICRIAALPGLEIEGLYTHFAFADNEDQKYTRWQLHRFLELNDCLSARGINIPIRHAANSAAAISLPESHLDMVRIGLSIYGLYPAPKHQEVIDLQAAMTLKTKVVYLKEVPPGTKVSYGCSYTTTRQSLLGTLPVGYGDGYSRSLSNRSMVLVRGQRAPVVGRVCMDQIVVDFSDIPGIRTGDVVVLFGKQGDSVLTADELAGWQDTINYEVVTTVSDRVPRVYLR